MKKTGSTDMADGLIHALEQKLSLLSQEDRIATLEDMNRALEESAARAAAKAT